MRSASVSSPYSSPARHEAPARAADLDRFEHGADRGKRVMLRVGEERVRARFGVGAGLSLVRDDGHWEACWHGAAGATAVVADARAARERAAARRLLLRAEVGWLPLSRVSRRRR